MFLSEAIKKRQQAFEKAEAMEKWAREQEFGTKELRWIEMKQAITKVVGNAYEEWHRYNDAIENDIQQLEIEISPFNVK